MNKVGRPVKITVSLEMDLPDEKGTMIQDYVINPLTHPFILYYPDKRIEENVVFFAGTHDDMHDGFDHVTRAMLELCVRNIRKESCDGR